MVHCKLETYSSDALSVLTPLHRHIHNVGGHPPGLPEILPIYYGKE